MNLATLSIIYSSGTRFEKVSAELADLLPDNDYGVVVTGNNAGEALRMFPLVHPNAALQELTKCASMLPIKVAHAAFTRIQERIAFDQHKAPQDGYTQRLDLAAVADAPTEKLSSSTPTTCLAVAKLSFAPVALHTVEDAQALIRYVDVNMSQLSSADVCAAAQAAHQVLTKVSAELPYPQWMPAQLGTKVSSVAVTNLNARTEKFARSCSLGTGVEAHRLATERAVSAIQSRDQIKLSKALHLVSEVEASFLAGDTACLGQTLMEDVVEPLTKLSQPGCETPFGAVFDVEDPYIYESGAIRIRTSTIRDIAKAPIHRLWRDYLSEDMLEEFAGDPEGTFKALPDAHKRLVATSLVPMLQSLGSSTPAVITHV